MRLARRTALSASPEPGFGSGLRLVTWFATPEQTNLTSSPSTGVEMIVAGTPPVSAISRITSKYGTS